MIETFKGPLGSHRNYIVHVALANGVDYISLKKRHQEDGRSATPDRYKELRYFLNAVESFNNIADYLYFEHEDRIAHGSVGKFRTALHAKYPELGDLAELANAYKHCVRGKEDKKTNKTKKNNRLLWARDLQRPALNIRITPGETKPSVEVDYEFPWPIEEHEAKLNKAFEFWLGYHNDDPKTADLITA
jgi:hypothetical protein